MVVAIWYMITHQCFKKKGSLYSENSDGEEEIEEANEKEMIVDIYF